MLNLIHDRRVLRGAAALCALGGALLIPAAASAATRNFIITDFDSVRLEAPIAVAIQNKRGVSARGEGDRDLLERIELVVSGRMLTIRLRPSPFGGRAQASGTARLFLTAPTLRRLQLAGSGALAADGLDAQQGEVLSAGSGALSVRNVASDTLSVAQVGAGSVSLAGKSAKLVMRLSGSGSIDATALIARDLELTAEGPASARAHATRAARVVAVGPGNVSVDGGAACTVRHAGSGTVTCGGASF